MKRNKIRNTIDWRRQQLNKIALTALLMVCTLAVSFFEVRVVKIMPNGGEFDFRLVDTIFILLATSIVGMAYTSIICVAQPWIHLAIDGDHLPISIAFYSVCNLIIALTFWALYIKLFKVEQLSLKDNKVKKITYFVISFVAVWIVATFVDFTSFVVSGIVNTGDADGKWTQNGLTATARLIGFFIILGLYFAKFIVVFFFYTLIKTKIAPNIIKYKKNTANHQNNEKQVLYNTEELSK